MSIFGGGSNDGLGGLGGLGGSGQTSGTPSVESIMEQAAKTELSKNLSTSLGAFILGWTFDFILWGVMIHQFVLWASNFKTEKLFSKIIVLASVSVATATTAFGIYYLWTAFVLNFGVFGQFVQVKKLAVYGVLDVLTVAPVQMFYLERAYRLMQRKIWIPLLIVPLILTSLVGGIGITVQAMTLTTFLEGPKLRKWFYTFLGPTCAADILLTGIIMFGLSQSKTGWSETDKLVNRLIRTSFETQLPGTIFAITFLIYYGLNQSSLFNAFFQLVFTKIYVVSLLAVLNYRYTIRKAVEGSQGSSSQRKTNTFNLSNRLHQETMQVDKIHVDTVVYEESHRSPEPRYGVNRLPDEESGFSTLQERVSDKGDGDGDGLSKYSSHTNLRRDAQEHNEKASD